MNSTTPGFSAAQDGLAYLNYFNDVPDVLRPSYRIGEPWRGEKIPEQGLHFRVYYTWEQYIALAKGLAKKIKESGIHYTRVVGLSKGGCFIAELIAHELGLPLGFIGLQSYQKDNQGSIIETFQSIPDTQDENLGKTIVVDDMRDSAKSLRYLRRMKTDSLGDFDIATLLTKDRPDAKDVEVKHTYFPDHPAVWVVQPGEGDFEQPTAGHDVPIGTIGQHTNLTGDAHNLAQKIQNHTSIIVYSHGKNPHEQSAFPMGVAIARITGKPLFPFTPATRHKVGEILRLPSCGDNPFVYTNDNSFSISGVQ